MENKYNLEHSQEDLGVDQNSDNEEQDFGMGGILTSSNDFCGFNSIA